MFILKYLLVSLISLSFAFPDFDTALEQENINASTSWSEAVVKEYSFNLNEKNKKIPLYVALTKRSTWTEERLLEEMQAVQNIFSQCSVEFSPLIVTQARASSSLHYEQLRPGFPKGDKILFKENFFKARPLVLIDHQYLGPEKDKDLAGYANRKSGYVHPSSRNTAFVFNRGYELQIENPPPHKGYSILAHEIAHVLFNESHNQENGNILCGAFECKGTSITSEQCVKLKEWKLK